MGTKEKKETKGLCPECGGKLVRKTKPDINRTYQRVVYYKCLGCSRVYYTGEIEKD